MIRLQRVGRTNDPSFRVVVTDSKNGPKSGKFLEIVGSHNPKTEATTIDAERVKHWLAHGAQPSGTLRNLLITQKIIDGKKVNVLPRKKPIVSEKAAAAAESGASAPSGSTPGASDEATPTESTS